jgi:hypothetical protein
VFPKEYVKIWPVDSWEATASSIWGRFLNDMASVSLLSLCVYMCKPRMQRSSLEREHWLATGQLRRLAAFLYKNALGGWPLACSYARWSVRDTRTSHIGAR